MSDGEKASMALHYALLRIASMIINVQKQISVISENVSREEAIQLAELRSKNDEMFKNLMNNLQEILDGK